MTNSYAIYLKNKLIPLFFAVAVPLAVSAAVIAAAIFVIRKSNSRRCGHDK